MIIRHLIEMVLNPFFISMLVFLIFLVFFVITLLRQRLISRQFNLLHLICSGFVFVFLLLLLCSTGWLPKSIIRSLEGQYPIVTQVDPRIHWIAVLSGGQSNVANMPADVLLNSSSIVRLVEGVRLYRQLPAAKLLLSGGSYDFKIPEAVRLSEVTSWFAVPQKDIVLEKTSINTAAQAVAIKKIVREEPFYLVTSAIHMPRSMALCRAQGLHPIAAPTNFIFYWDDGRWEKTYLPNPWNLYYLSIAMHEILGSLASKFIN